MTTAKITKTTKATDTKGATEIKMEALADLGIYPKRHLKGVYRGRKTYTLRYHLAGWAEDALACGMAQIGMEPDRLDLDKAGEDKVCDPCLAAIARTGELYGLDEVLAAIQEVTNR